MTDPINNTCFQRGFCLAGAASRALLTLTEMHGSSQSTAQTDSQAAMAELCTVRTTAVNSLSLFTTGDSWAPSKNGHRTFAILVERRVVTVPMTLGAATHQRLYG